MDTYTVRLTFDQFEFQADMADAASPIRADGEDTPFQVADAAHSPTAAALLLLKWWGADYHGVADDRVADLIVSVD